MVSSCVLCTSCCAAFASVGHKCPSSASLQCKSCMHHNNKVILSSFLLLNQFVTARISIIHCNVPIAMNGKTTIICTYFIDNFSTFSLLSDLQIVWRWRGHPSITAVFHSQPHAPCSSSTDKCILSSPLSSPIRQWG